MGRDVRNQPQRSERRRVTCGCCGGSGTQRVATRRPYGPTGHRTVYVDRPCRACGGAGYYYVA